MNHVKKFTIVYIDTNVLDMLKNLNGQLGLM